jgi:hypothetical protein
MTASRGIVQYGGASPVMGRRFLRLRVSLQFGFMPLGGMSIGACVVLGVLRFTSIFTQEVFEWELWAFINEGRGRFSRSLLNPLDNGRRFEPRADSSLHRSPDNAAWAAVVATAGGTMQPLRAGSPGQPEMDQRGGGNLEPSRSADEHPPSRPSGLYR